MPKPTDYSAQVFVSEAWRKYIVDETRHIRERSMPPDMLAVLRTVSEAEAARAAACGYAWREWYRLGDDNPGYTYAPMRCHSRWCQSCAAYRRSELAERWAAVQAELGPGMDVLITLTGGPTVSDRALPGRYHALQEAFRTWRQSARRRGGLLGTYRSVEVSISPGPRYHPHIHVIARFGDAARWLALDTRLVTGRVPIAHVTAAYAWLYTTWAAALRLAAPRQYARLPLLTDVWSVERIAAYVALCDRLGLDAAERYVACDIGGRTPGKPGKHSWFDGFDVRASYVDGAAPSWASYWLPLPLVTADPTELFKYAAKGWGQYGVQPADYRPVMMLMRGKRRCQATGIFYGVGVDERLQRERIGLACDAAPAAVTTGRYVCAFEGRTDQADRAAAYAVSLNNMATVEDAIERTDVRLARARAPGRNVVLAVDRVEGGLLCWRWKEE